jgi:ABC-2 type transport system permease protein
VARKDITELLRNRLGLAMLVLMPVFMMAMVGFIFPSETTPSQVSLAMANEDAGHGAHPKASLALVAALQMAGDGIEITNASGLDEMRQMIQRGEVDGGILIPANFSSSLADGQQGTIMVVTDQSNPQMSIALQSVFKEMIEQMGTYTAQQNIQRIVPAVDPSDTLAIVKPYRIEMEGAVEGDLSYFDFMAPGLMAMTVMMSVMTGLPAAISHEKEIGTLDGMMVAPINRLTIILGKTLAQTTRGLLQGSLILVLAVILFGVTIHGNILLIFALLLLGVFSFVGLGVVITSFAKDQETAGMMMMTLMFPMMFMSGVFFPIGQMPWFMQAASRVLPLTYSARALRKVMLLGAGIPAISTELAVLIGFGIVMTIVAVPTFKRAMVR